LDLLKKMAHWVKTCILLINHYNPATSIKERKA